MKRYIDVDELIEIARKNKAIGQALCDIFDFIQIVDDTPTADVKEVVHAQWDSSSESYRCTNCARALDELMDGESYFSGRINIEKEVICCPFCGADMKQEVK